MEYQLTTHQDQSYVECLPTQPLDSEAAALDLVAACGEFGVNRLLLPANCLPGDFFNLRTGLAGQILLKFSMYRLRVAAVLSPDQVHGRFKEMVTETNRGNQFRVFYDRQSAEQWLLQS